MNIGKMMKDLQRMQSQIQEKMDVLEVEGSAGGGMVTVRMDGKKTLLAVRVDPGAVQANDLDLLGDLVVAAVNDAGRKVDEAVVQLTQGLAGAKIPGLF